MSFSKFITIISLCFIGLSVQAQSFGVRAGLNYSKFLGPAEAGGDDFAGESFGLSGGFHFGVNYSYHVTDLFSVVAEIGYTQNGSKRTYEGDSYFIIREENRTIYEPGHAILDLDVSNGYLMLPILANYKLTNKFEVFGGAYFNLLVSPTAGGTFDFTSTNPQVPGEDEIFFVQQLDYNYRGDEAGAASINNRDVIGVYVGGDDVRFAKTVGAYYQYAEKKANYINAVDVGLIGGVNYFLNKGFYAGLRLEYGLTDITDGNADTSINSLDSENQLIFREDNDTHLGVNISIGFRF